MGSEFKSLSPLLFKNRLVKNRVVVSGLIIPAFFFLIIILIGHEINLSVNYTFVFLLGWFFHSYVSIFVISMTTSYSKFLIFFRLEKSLMIIIFVTGLILSLFNGVILSVLISQDYLKAEIGQVWWVLVFSNFVVAPISIWISSFEFVRMNLFEAEMDRYQPRSIHIGVMMLSFLIITLFNWTYPDWPNQIGWLSMLLAVIVACFWRFFAEGLRMNFKRTIAWSNHEDARN